MERSDRRVERQANGWYETSKERFVPMLQDIYFAGRRGPVDTLRELKRDVEDLKRRGA